MYKRAFRIITIKLVVLHSLMDLPFCLAGRRKSSCCSEQTSHKIFSSSFFTFPPTALSCALHLLTGTKPGLLSAPLSLTRHFHRSRRRFPLSLTHANGQWPLACWGNNKIIQKGFRAKMNTKEGRWAHLPSAGMPWK